MKTPSVPRVIRAYSLPVSQFDHLKAFQRSLQHRADASDEPGHEVTNSEALARIVRHHELLSVAAANSDRDLTSFITGLYLGDLRVVEVSA